jgi:drug/metabolite transporter (DMT)-like permease
MADNASTKSLPASALAQALLIAAIVLRERIRVHNIAGMAIAGAGLVLIAMSESGGSARLSLPLLFMLHGAAALFLGERINPLDAAAAALIMAGLAVHVFGGGAGQTTIRRQNFGSCDIL